MEERANFLNELSTTWSSLGTSQQTTLYGITLYSNGKVQDFSDRIMWLNKDRQPCFTTLLRITELVLDFSNEQYDAFKILVNPILSQPPRLLVKNVFGCGQPATDANVFAGSFQPSPPSSLDNATKYFSDCFRPPSQPTLTQLWAVVDDGADVLYPPADQESDGKDGHDTKNRKRDQNDDKEENETSFARPVKKTKESKDVVTVKRKLNKISGPGINLDEPFDDSSPCTPPAKVPRRPDSPPGVRSKKDLELVSPLTSSQLYCYNEYLSNRDKPDDDGPDSDATQSRPCYY
jgi:hypothetical protein